MNKYYKRRIIWNYMIILMVYEIFYFKNNQNKHLKIVLLIIIYYKFCKPL